MNRLLVLRNLIAWGLLRALFPKALARVEGAAVLLLRESAPIAGSSVARLPGQLSTELIDLHPARPTPQRRSVSDSLGARTAHIRRDAFVPPAN